MMYRILTPLDMGKRGIMTGLISSSQLSEQAVTRLLLVGAISTLSAPPLAVLPGWDARSTLLAAREIVTADQFLEADDAYLAETLEVTNETIIRLKRAVTIHLLPPSKRGG